MCMFVYVRTKETSPINFQNFNFENNLTFNVAIIKGNCTPTVTCSFDEKNPFDRLIKQRNHPVFVIIINVSCW